MKYLNKKLRRDIINNWTQFFSVFLMACLSVLVFVGLQGAWHGLEESLNNYIESSELPDSWIQSIGFTDDDINKISNLPGIEFVSEKIRIKTLVDAESSQEKYLILDTFNNSSTKPYLIEGKEISNNQVHGIWVNKEYAEKNNISVGEKIKITYENITATVDVLGIIQSADRIYFTGSLEFIAPNYSNYGYGVITEDTLKEYFQYRGPANLIEVNGTNENIRENIENILGNKFIAYYDRSTLVDVSDALDRVGQIRNLSFLFSFIFILLAILAMYTTIRRIIETQTKEIAILKALGFSNRKIGLHYSSFGLLVGGGGAFLGVLISPLMSMFVLSTQKNMFSIPIWEVSYSSSSLIVILLVITICVVSAFFASRESVSGLPALFLRGNEKKGKKILFEKASGIWSKLKIKYRWSIRDASINRVRLIMGIVGVAGSMMLLIAGFGMPESMYHLVDKAYNNDYSYEYRLEVKDYKKFDNTYDGQWVQISQARYTPDDGHNRLLIVLSEGEYVNMITEEGERIVEGGIYLTKGFADRANIKKGDKIVVNPSLSNDEYSFTVSGIITSETNQGAYIMQKTWEEAGGEFFPQTLLVGNNVSISDIEKDTNISSVITKNDQEENAYDFVNGLMSVFLMIIAFAVLLVVVVLYNLGSLSFVERNRDYATLRVLGFHKREIRNITMIENLITTFVGWIIGIPSGVLFLEQYVRTFSTIRLEYTSYLSLRTLVLATLVSWICSLTTTFFISRRIQRLDMVESLKGVE